MSEKQTSALPLVKDVTNAQSENIQTVVSRLRNKRVYIPDYQRDANQWDARKQSLFLESLLNNLTIPAFFFCADKDLNYEVVDGQQRLTTILEFANDAFTISDDDSIVYLLPQAAQYRGKKYSELKTELTNIFDDYPLTIIYLPRNLTLNVKLEIFRRINEGGTPLTGQDIRLAYYSQSKSVTFIRLAGIYSDSEAAERMIESAKKSGISNPWENYPEAWELWRDWWEDKARAKGQTPSLMFLWYLVCLGRNQLESILSLPGGGSHLGIAFRGTTEEALDIYCAQLQYQESIKDQSKSSEYTMLNILPSLKSIEENSFQKFAIWIKNILSRGMPGISVDKDKQLALFIAGAVELNITPDKLSNEHWNLVNRFVRSPRQAGQEILSNDETYPEPKGRWSGPRGQKVQCDKAVEVVKKIIEL